MYNFKLIDMSVFLRPKYVKGVHFFVLQKFTQADIVILIINFKF